MPDGQEHYRLAIEGLNVIELRALARLRDGTLPATEKSADEP
jgi:hypothetical protein